MLIKVTVPLSIPAGVKQALAGILPDGVNPVPQPMQLPFTTITYDDSRGTLSLDGPSVAPLVVLNRVSGSDAALILSSPDPVASHNRLTGKKYKTN